MDTIFNSRKTPRPGTYRIDNNIAIELRVRAALFDALSFIFSALSLGITATGLLKTGALGALAGVAVVIPSGITQGIAAVLGLANVTTLAPFLIVGFFLSLLGTMSGAASWVVMRASFGGRGVNTFMKSFLLGLVKLIPIPGVSMLMPFHYSILTAWAISDSRKEDRERAENAEVTMV